MIIHFIKIYSTFNCLRETNPNTPLLMDPLRRLTLLAGAYTSVSKLLSPMSNMQLHGGIYIMAPLLEKEGQSDKRRM